MARARYDIKDMKVKSLVRESQEHSRKCAGTSPNDDYKEWSFCQQYQEHLNNKIKTARRDRTKAWNEFLFYEDDCRGYSNNLDE